MLNSPILIVKLSVSLFNYVHMCFVYFGALCWVGCIYLYFYFYSSLLLYCSSGRDTERSRHRQRALPSAASLSKCTHCVGLVQTEISSPERIPGLPHGLHATEHLIHHQLPHQVRIRRKVGWNQSWDLITGIPKWEVGMGHLDWFFKINTQFHFFYVLKQFELENLFWWIWT